MTTAEMRGGLGGGTSLRRCVATIVLCLFALLALPSAAADFQLALPGYRYSFPRDHAAHPQFQTEWWYYTGHLAADDGRPYGFELVFFRHGLKREVAKGSSRWEITDAYPAHFALTDVAAGTFSFHERINRPALGIAGARDDFLRTWNEDWIATEVAPGKQRLYARAGDLELDLLATSRKPPVIHGKDGVSQKAACKGCASHYVSLTRLAVEGLLVQGGQARRVKGLAWMDHEFGSGQLATDIQGWDWFSLQLADGTELMLYDLRGPGGMATPFSSGTWVDARGQAHHLAQGDFRVAVLGKWTSPHTKASYPAKWRLTVPRQGLDLVVTPKLADQELRTGKSTQVDYWEGACGVEGTRAGKPVKGDAYVELTGYAKPFGARF